MKTPVQVQAINNAVTSQDNEANVLARAARDRERLSVCDEIEQLISTVSAEHPHLAIRELVPFLLEPERSRLVVLLAELPEIVPFGVEGNAL